MCDSTKHLFYLVAIPPPRTHLHFKHLHIAASSMPTQQISWPYQVILTHPHRPSPHCSAKLQPHSTSPLGRIISLHTQIVPFPTTSYTVLSMVSGWVTTTKRIHAFKQAQTTHQPGSIPQSSPNPWRLKLQKVA